MCVQRGVGVQPCAAVQGGAEPAHREAVDERIHGGVGVRQNNRRVQQPQRTVAVGAAAEEEISVDAVERRPGENEHAHNEAGRFRSLQVAQAGRALIGVQTVTLRAAVQVVLIDAVQLRREKR